jgi:hypothetical protein
MLSNHTHERLVALGLAGMAKALDDQQRQPDVTALTFEQRLGLMIDREATERENKRLIVRLKFASLRQTAIVEDIDLRAPRGIDRAFFAKLVDGDWIGRKQNLLITGPTECDSCCSSLDLLKNPTLSDADCQTTDAEVGGPELLG